MRAFDELVTRLATRRSDRLGGLSPSAYEELVLAVRKDPEAFVDGDDDQAFLILSRALERHASACDGQDMLDDDDFYAARARRLRRLVDDCHEALRVDGTCLDAALVAVLATDEEPCATLEALLELRSLVPRGDEVPARSWDDVRGRAALRLDAAISRTCLDTARYRMAVSAGERAMTGDGGDPLGARHTCALALARLEDEAAFDALDARFGRAGDAWSHLGRLILLYKLGRAGAARRAALGLGRLVEGSMYALLRPIAIDTYLPDRPEADDHGYDGATLAVWEAEPIIVDVPDLPAWVAGQDDLARLAADFAARHDLDW